MPLNIIDDPGLMGHFGKTLSTGLQELIKAKSASMQARHQKQQAQQGLGALGLNPQEAAGISQLPQDMQSKILLAYLQRGGGAPGSSSETPETSGSGQIGGAGLAGTLQQPTLKERRHQANEDRKFQFKIEQAKRENQNKLSPFLKKESENFKNSHKLKKVAQDLLENLEKNASKFPGALVGNLPEAARNLLIRDPNVRKYMADANKAVILAAQTRKGVPSNYKIRMEQLAKGDISMPIETQKEIWRSFIEAEDLEEQRHKFIRKQKDKNGFFPEDIEQLANDFELSQDNPLEYPEFFEEGTEYLDVAGKKHRLTDGQWKEL